MPISIVVGFACALMILFGRWFTARFIRAAQKGAESLERISETYIRCMTVPTWVSSMYMIGALGYLVAAIWSSISVVWWVLLLAVPLWIVIHIPWARESALFRESSRITDRVSHAMQSMESRQ
jgi:hypothetical protein